IMFVLPRLVRMSGCLIGGCLVSSAGAAEARLIKVETAHSALVLGIADDGRLYELGYGRPRERQAPRRAPAREDEFHPPGGNGYILEPALQAVHADGNTSTELAYVGVESVTDPK